jgi:hypothetical protein
MRLGPILLAAFCLHVGSTVIAETSEKASGLRLKILGKNLPMASAFHVDMDIKTCGKERKSESILLGKNSEFQNVVAWLEPQDNRKPRVIDHSAPSKVDIVIKDCDFHPRILLIAPDQPLEIRSEDPILFQVRSLGLKNPKQNRALPPNLDSVIMRFRESEIVPLVSDLHPWMHAYVVVTTYPLYGISDSKGEIHFHQLPLGTYSLFLWHETLGKKIWPEPITIDSGSKQKTLEWDYLQTESSIQK